MGDGRTGLLGCLLHGGHNLEFEKFENHRSEDSGVPVELKWEAAGNAEVYGD